MAEEDIEKRISELSAKVTALTMLVESLYVTELAKDDHAAAIGDAMIKSLLKAEEAARGRVGQTDYGLRISEAASSLIDRAVARAIAQRAKRSRK